MILEGLQHMGIEQTNSILANKFDKELEQDIMNHENFLAKSANYWYVEQALRFQWTWVVSSNTACDPATMDGFDVVSNGQIPRNRTNPVWKGCGLCVWNDLLPVLSITQMLHGAGIWIPAFARTKSTSYVGKYTLWLFNIAMGNGPFIEVYQVYLLEMAIFHGYVK